ncbi:hypothetical protein H6F32_00915 [Anabaena sp. FACHB-1237]|uniref:hypothetical protein n=1 Tax=Anabaena sp. FACHB-1237 TaxID=2692769 RepID=UPI001680BECE|nr:hypothetical protein [Anabaena sp. FACHB-1237]MBD2136172.1 hypothetical protein [Anabaena sp. FACHB-1237]
MATIVISDLQPIDLKIFLQDLNSAQTQEILGSSLIPLWRSSDVQLNTFYDGINNRETSYKGPFSFYENKIFTVDFARTAIYLVI